MYHQVNDDGTEVRRPLTPEEEAKRVEMQAIQVAIEKERELEDELGRRKRRPVDDAADAIRKDIREGKTVDVKTDERWPSR